MKGSDENWDSLEWDIVNLLARTHVASSEHTLGSYNFDQALVPQSIGWEDWMG